MTKRAGLEVRSGFGTSGQLHQGETLRSAHRDNGAIIGRGLSVMVLAGARPLPSSLNLGSRFYGTVIP